MKKIDFNNDRFAVIGIGITGLSIIKYLQFRHANIVNIFDTRENIASDLYDNYHKITSQQCICGKLQVKNFVDIDVVVISPGVSIYDPVLQELVCNNVQIVGDIELFALAIHNNWDSKIIGVTGSNGKTTVVSMLGYLTTNIGINVLMAGNIGTPVLDSYLDIIHNNHAIPALIILELSSFQLETTYNLYCDAATVLNISEDHLDRYTNLLQYAYIKSQIFNNCKTQIINCDDSFITAMWRKDRLHKYFYYQSSPQFIDGQNCNNNFQLIDNIENDNLSHNNMLLSFQINDEQIKIPCASLQLIGKHNYLNILSVLALLDCVNINVKQYPKMLEFILQFKGIEHRMQKVTTNNNKGVIAIEDSKGTNVGATIAGLNGLSMPIHLILGGDGKGQNFAPLKNIVASKCLSITIIGKDRHIIADAIQNDNINIKLYDTLLDAVKFCYEQAKKDECILLSPACASWDMFQNYKHRAKEFIDIISHIDSL